MHIFFYYSNPKYYGRYMFRDEWNGRTLRPRGIFYDKEWDLYFRILEIIIIDGEYHVILTSYWPFFSCWPDYRDETIYGWMEIP